MTSTAAIHDLSETTKRLLKTRQTDIRKSLLEIRELANLFEDLTFDYDRNDARLVRQLRLPEVDFQIINSLCLHITHCLTYLEKSDPTPEDLNLYQENVFKINKILESHFQGEDWTPLSQLMKVIATTTFIAAFIFAFASSSPTGILFTIGLFCISVLSLTTASYFDKKGFNYSVSSRLNFFKSENHRPDCNLEPVDQFVENQIVDRAGDIEVQTKKSA